MSQNTSSGVRNTGDVVSGHRGFEMPLVGWLVLGVVAVAFILKK